MHQIDRCDETLKMLLLFSKAGGNLKKSLIIEKVCYQSVFTYNTSVYNGVRLYARILQSVASKQ